MYTNYDVHQLLLRIHCINHSLKSSLFGSLYIVKNPFKYSRNLHAPPQHSTWKSINDLFKLNKINKGFVTLERKFFLELFGINCSNPRQDTKLHIINIYTISDNFIDYSLNKF